MLLAMREYSPLASASERHQSLVCLFGFPLVALFFSELMRRSTTSSRTVRPLHQVLLKSIFYLIFCLYFAVIMYTDDLPPSVEQTSNLSDNDFSISNDSSSSSFNATAPTSSNSTEPEITNLSDTLNDLNFANDVCQTDFCTTFTSNSFVSLELNHCESTV